MNSTSTGTGAMPGFFSAHLAERDPEVFKAIGEELHRQQDQIELIASENIVSRAVLEAQGSVLTNKYAEGYPGRRYYGGCEFVDVAEALAIERAKKLFDCDFANVQPHSGAQANQAVFFALLQPGDTFMGLNLAAGGHLTHGSPVNQSGKWFKAVPYSVRREDQRVDMDEVERLAKEHKPKLILAGGSAYPRFWDFERFRQIADAVGAYFMVDMAHFAGLVAGGVHPSPLPHAHVVTTTTHKTLRGPRGGMILAKDEDIGKKINSAVFPGLQGGPLMHVIAAKAVAFGEALRPEFKRYAAAVVENAKVLAETLVGRRLRHHHRRHRQPSDAGRSPAQEADRQGLRAQPRGRPASPATRTAFPSIRRSRRSPRACVSARRRPRPAASARPSSARWASSSSACSTGWRKAIPPTMPRSSARSAPRWRRSAASFRSMTVRVRTGVRPSGEGG